MPLDLFPMVSHLKAALAADALGRRSSPGVVHRFHQSVYQLKLMRWAGVGLAAAQDVKESSAAPELQAVEKGFPMWAVLITLFVVAIGMLVAEQLLYGGLSKLPPAEAARPTATATNAVPAAHPTAEMPPSSGTSDMSEFEMVDEPS
mmetsp:Transcript_2542/g.3830  ORF Transcript_2542/g.3830 Transcript_2542/m.3830 type:complete len:147 (+) Transcript_2542:28-468(+)